MLTDKHSPLSAAQNLAVASLGVYAALAFFSLTFRLPPVTPSLTVGVRPTA
jgi:hypothetical protein